VLEWEIAEPDEAFLTPGAEKIGGGDHRTEGPQVDGINQRFEGAATRDSTIPVSVPGFFPHELARSPKRGARTEGLAIAEQFGAVHPGNPKSRLMVLFSNCGASRALRG